MEEFGFLLFLWWIIGTVVNVMIASEKNRSVGSAIVTSIFLSPLVSYLYLLAVPVKMIDANKTNKENKNKEK